jgi:hypothetical protein
MSGPGEYALDKKKKVKYFAVGHSLVVKKTALVAKLVEVSEEKDSYKLQYPDGQYKWHKRTECVSDSLVRCTVCRGMIKSLYKRNPKGWLQTFVGLHGNPTCVGSFAPSEGCRLL